MNGSQSIQSLIVDISIIEFDLLFHSVEYPQFIAIHCLLSLGVDILHSRYEELLK